MWSQNDSQFRVFHISLACDGSERKSVCLIGRFGEKATGKGDRLRVQIFLSQENPKFLTATLFPECADLIFSERKMCNCLIGRFF